MRFSRIALFGLTVAGGCTPFPSDPCDATPIPSTCPNAIAATDGGTDGADSGVTPPGCDLTKSPKDSAACVDDSVGVFVSPSGDDGATGGKAAPVKTVAKGLELAASHGLPRAYVCEGTYDANVEVKAAVGVYGGLSCAWAYTGAKPKLAPAKGVAFRVTKVSGPVVLEDFEVIGSADASVAGDSAIAAFVSESTNVTFRNVTLTAGAGTPGAQGASRSNYSGAATAGGLTNTAGSGNGPSCTCVDLTSSKGGAGSNGAGLGVENGSAVPTVGTLNSGSVAAGACTPGSVGANGAAAGTGTASTTSGALSAKGWSTSAIGDNGANGNPGQGGGGGGGRTDLNLGGGGGGCGGCGGAGGGAGGIGGSSFALLSFNSTTTISGGTLVSDVAGRGGNGGNGQPGQDGGLFGAGVCNGGPGGAGAGGSGGGGGAGGHSVPIGFVGTEPSVSGATLTPGTKGGGGAGGGPGAGPGNAGTAGSQGPDGKAQSSLSL